MDKYAALSDPDMKEIFESFLIETKEIFERLDIDLIELENKPNDSELLNNIFRSFHTVKGTSGFLGLERMQKLTHRAEDLLNKLRKGELAVTHDIMDVILQAYDGLKGLLNVIETRLNEDFEIEPYIYVLEDALSGNAEAPAEDQFDKEILEELARREAVNHLAETVAGENGGNGYHADAGLPENNHAHDAAPHTNGHEPEKISPEDQAQQKKVADTLRAATVRSGDNTIRVDVQRLDDLLNIVSELVLGRNRLSQVSLEAGLQYEGTKLSRDLSDASRMIDLMTTELQLAVMKTRMIKIGKVFNKFPRVVRDLSKETGKQIKLEIRGEETELDKTLIEEINDPLVHLVRNSIDHGIEPPEKRIAAGKPIEGTITLSAEQEGNNILVFVEDDGGGINQDKIKEKAINKGIISREKAKELTKQETYGLLFLPGFSTAEKVTNISGRGVGLDVVKTNVAKLRGAINIDSELGKGTRFIIKLPLTLAIIQGLLVTVRDETVVIPLSSVLEVVRISNEQIHNVNRKQVIKLRDTVIPLVSIDSLLYQKEEEEKTGYQYVVIVGIAEKKFGIKVDTLIGQKEVVIKTLGEYLGSIRGIAGSTIMGDGRVVMIIDLAELLNIMVD